MSGANGAALAFGHSTPELNDELAGNKLVLSPLAARKVRLARPNRNPANARRVRWERRSTTVLLCPKAQENLGKLTPPLQRDVCGCRKASAHL
jgi:hypothetical protein